jgi:hypothetical protein
MGLGTSSVQPSRISSGLNETLASCLRHLADEPDGHKIICSAISFILQDETRIRFGDPLRCDAIGLIRRSITNNWGARPDKLREAVRDLLATLKGDSRRTALAAFGAIRAAIQAGVIPDIDKTIAESRSDDLAAAAGVPCR